MIAQQTEVAKESMVQGDMRLAVDTGGTFTDVVLTDEDGQMSATKALTRFDDPWGSIEEALWILAAEAGGDVATLLARCGTFSYATTRATNAILTKTSARTALVTTEGFPDILTLRQGGRADPFDFLSSFPDPYVPRSLTFELGGRMDSTGAVLKPFDDVRAVTIIDEMVERGVEAVAVSLLWAHVNPDHELAIAQLLDARAAEIPYTLSHQLNPIIREYPRASSTALDASLKPLMQAHYRELESALRGAGFAGEFLAVTASGGCLPIAGIVEKPIFAIDSGPSVAPVAARTYADEVDVDDVVVYDTGGTSFDVSLIAAGEIATTRDRWLGEEFTGNLLGISSVAVHSIGAGGGSIAWTDDGGLLHVGPQSAGSNPGPACYGLGGTDPTVTDAAAVAGYLDPDFFLGGRIALDLEAARRAIADQVATPLDISVDHAARAILGIANDAMVGAIREITVNQGIDPRDSLLVAGGGAGGMNVVDIARDLGCSRAMVPRAAGTLSAVGAQFSDLVAEFSRSAVTNTREFDSDGVESAFEGLAEQMKGFVDSLDARGVRVNSVDRSYFVEARYPDQVWDLRVPVDWHEGPLSDAALAGAEDRFHDLHLRTFAVNDPSSPIECQQWTGCVTARTSHPSPLIRLAGEGKHPPGRTRQVLFADGSVETRIVSGGSLAAGESVEGPAIIEETTTTLVLPPGSRATTTENGSYLIDV